MIPETSLRKSKNSHFSKFFEIPIGIVAVPGCPKKIMVDDTFSFVEETKINIYSKIQFGESMFKPISEFQKLLDPLKK